jgi:hypothetical protein
LGRERYFFAKADVSSIVDTSGTLVHESAGADPDAAPNLLRANR